MAKSLLLAATFLAICSIAAGLPGGAPTFGNVCNDLTQQHFGSSGLIAPISCETLCPYTVSLTNVGGGAVPAGKEGFYRCGSMHRLCINASDGNQFKGFAIQARETSVDFANSSSDPLVGAFTNAPTVGGDWRIWPCAGGDSATHTNRVDKTEVCFDWMAPEVDLALNVTFWFSITRVFATFHSQLRGLDLQPDPAFCDVPTTPPPTTSPPTTMEPVELLNLECQAEFLTVAQQVSISCSSSNGDISTLQFQCSLDGESVTVGCGVFPFLISVAGQVGQHEVVLNATNSSSGSSAQYTIRYNLGTPVTLAPLTFSCQANFSSDSKQLSISCSSSREISTLDIVCFLDDIAQTDGCGEFPYIVSTAGQAGNHSVRFEVSGSDGSSASAVISYSLPPFGLLCGLGSVNPSGPINVDCESVSGDVEGVVCDFDDGALIEDCSLNFAINFTRFSPGNHSLVITATSTSGVTSSFSVPFTVPEPLDIFCVQRRVPLKTTVTCSSNNRLRNLPLCVAKARFGAAITVPCELDVPFVFEFPDYVPIVVYTLTVSGIDVFEQSASEVIDLEIDSEPLLSVRCEASENQTTATCVSTLDGIVPLTYSCKIESTPFPCGPEPTFELPIESLETGYYIISVSVRSVEGQMALDSILIFIRPGRRVECIQRLGIKLINLDCIVVDGAGSVSNAVCIYDDGRPLEDPCNITLIEIDQFIFSPGYHDLSINYTFNDGELGQFVFEFEGETRPRISIGFAANPSDFNITEGSSVSLKGQTTGFSYGDVPIQVTPLACSDYEGDLEELFTNIPADSADPVEDLVDSDAQVVTINLGFFRPPFNFVGFLSRLDNVTENEECLVVELSVNEEELEDERDRGQVDFVRNVALLRLRDPTFDFELTCDTSEVSPSGPISVTCSTVNGDAESVSCNYDDRAIVEDCSLNVAIDFTRFSPGGHSLVITATSTSGATSSFSTGFTIPEPLVLTCVQGAVSGRVEVTCSASKRLFQPLFCQVTADGGSPMTVRCAIDEAIVFRSPDFIPGVSYSLTVSGTDVDQQTDTEVVEFEIAPLPEKILTCRPLIGFLGARELKISCQVIGGTVESAVCVYDDGSRTDDPCDISSIEIDQFTFSPGPHELLINYTCVNGDTGEFVYEFEGETRPRISIGFADDSLDFNVTEGFGFLLNIQATGFSYGNVPLQVTPLACSDYEGDLEQLFTNIPADSADPAKDVDNADVQEVDVDLGFVIVPRLFAIFSARTDTVRENEECLVVELSVNEEELEDERDRGQVDFVRNVVLARLREKRILIGFANVPLDFNITEGSDVLLNIQTTGFSYGNVPIQVTPLACSDYKGDLEELFTNIPADSADPGEDLVLADARVVTVNFSLGPPTEGVVFISRPDNVTENEECLVVELSVNEEELEDERDRGQVGFERSVALLRLRDFELTCGTSAVSPSGPINVTCGTANGDAESVSCNYDDGAIVEDCSLNFTIDFTRFSPGGHILVITATSTSGATSSFDTGFTVPEPLVFTCLQEAVLGGVEVTCSASKRLYLPLVCQVTADGGSPMTVRCFNKETIVFNSPDFIPGVSYSLTVSGTDLDKQTNTEVVEFEIAPLPEKILMCSPIRGFFGARELKISCEVIGGRVESAVCIYDDGSRTDDPCDISSIEIDQFTFSPGPHELLINFTCVNGDTGKFVYEFEGETRPRISIGFADDSLDFNVTEGFGFLLNIQATGFSYGNVPIQVTPLACSDYEGDLEELFTNIPADSADPAKDVDNADAQEVVVDLGFDFLPLFLFAIYSARTDTERENEECLVVELSVNEEELEDERDRGQVDFVRNVALARLREPRILIGFADGSLDFNVTEGSDVLLNIQATGFSYGDIPIQVTPLACSDYEGDLEELFTNIPADSADPGEDLVLADAQVVTLNFSLGPPTEGVVFISRPDNVTENEECLVVELSVNEEELEDERDRGQVGFERSVALLRLRDFKLTCGASAVSPSGPVNVTCSTANGDAESVSCNYDGGAIVEDCSLNFAIDFTRFSPGGHSLVITATSTSGATSSFSTDFTVPEPLFFTCLQEAVLGGVEVTCSANKQLFLPLVCQVTADGGSPMTVQCFNNEKIVFNSPDFIPGVSYSLTVSGIDLDKQTNTEVVEFEIVPLPEKILMCSPIRGFFGARELKISCQVIGGRVESAVCIYDDGSRTDDPCDISSIEIDQFTFSPGPHELLINFTCVNGDTGKFVYEFEGETRPRISIGFADDSLDFNVTEGFGFLLNIQATGFSYGNVPIQVTPLACSDYEGDLEELFTNIPADSADPAKDVDNADAQEVVVDLGFDFIPPLFAIYSARRDTERENEECLVVELSVNEEELEDERDRGQVDFVRKVALARLREPRISIGFADDSLDFNVTEGSDLLLNIQATGFSYGDIPIQVTPIACSDYEGDLEELFTNIPADSADPGEDLVLADAQVLTINFSLGPPTEGVVFISRPDKVTENEECLVVELSVNEEELDDERDRGQVNFDRNVALVRLRDPIVEKTLECRPLTGTRVLSISCQVIGGTVESAVCVYDNGSRTDDPCDLSSIEIDQFTFSPGPHELLINYTCDNGDTGEFVYEFEGETRPRISISFDEITLVTHLTEGIGELIFIQATGFSYGDVPVQITPLACSDYEGDLEELFTDIPADSADPAEDLDDARVQKRTFDLGFSFPGPPSFVILSVVNDGIHENDECLIVELSVNEEELEDERDRGQVDIKNVALIRLQEIRAEIECETAFDFRFILLTCSGLHHPIFNLTCSFDDGRPPISPCNVNRLGFDKFTFSPSPHVLRIDVFNTMGHFGVFEYNFTGVVRPRISVDFSLNSVDLTVTEGEMINFIVIAFGFSYDFFPVQLTVLPCSGYPGDLSALFDNIPQDSASPTEDILGNQNVSFELIPGEFLDNPIRHQYTIVDDGILENEECLVFTLSVDEDKLDERDRGELDIVRSVLLLRIEDGTLRCSQALNFASILVDCDADFVFDVTTCSFDGAPAERCNLPLVIDQLQFSVRPHTLTIEAFGASVNDSTELQFNGIDEDTLPVVYVLFGDTNVRTLSVKNESEAILSVGFRIQGPTFGPVQFNVLTLTYQEFEAQVSGRDLDDIFPSRPVAAGSGDFNSSTVRVDAVLLQVIDDLEAELTEGYILLLQLDVPNTDPRDVRRIKFLNDIVLVAIEDDDTIECSSSVDDDVATISCDDLDGEPVEVTGDLLCSIDFGAPEACFLPLAIPVSEFSPGRHNVRVLRSEAGQPIPEEIIGGTSLNVEPLEVYFINDTPVLTVDRLFAEFRASRPNVTLECHLTHLDFTREDCSSGQFDRSGIPPGDYTLRVIARDPSRPLEKRAVARNRIWVHGDDVFCITGVQNRGLTINGNSATVEFYSTGVATGFKCVLDRTEIIENCTSPYTIERLSLGRHHFKVIPLGCERLYRANTMQFYIN